MKQILVVACGGAIGAALRYTAGQLIRSNYDGNFPMATFLVNISGCFVLGIFCAWMAGQASTHTLQLFVSIGLLGGFTTFSSFGLECFNMLKNGQVMLAGAYLFLSNAIGLLAVAGGFGLLKLLRV